MEIDKIIEGLNRKEGITNIGSGNFPETSLTEVEKTFIKTYSPEKSLIVYGTLAPNAPNHSVIKHIKGNWQQGIVRGSLEKKGWGAELGYYGFKQTSNEKQEDWQLLDDFEGNGYKRILAKYELENGQIGVGNIYAINEEE